MVQVEVKEASKDEFKTGDYLISNDGHYTVIVAKVLNRETFTAQVIKARPGLFSKEGDYNETWNTASFRKFYGTITIKCD